MVVKTANEYMADELLNRVKHLQKALFQAEKIISSLEQENNNLKNVLNNLTCINKEDYGLSKEIFNESVCSV